MRFIKDPDAKKDYGVDWTGWLATKSDTIATVSWDVPAGLTVTAVSGPQATPTVWLSGGTVGETYTVTCHITTAGGRIDDQSFSVRIAEK